MKPLDEWLATAALEAPADELRRLDELHAAVALYVNHGPLRDRERALTVTRFGSALALRDLARPAEGRSNRVIGLEADGLERVIEELARFYEDAGIPCQLDLLPSRCGAETRALLAAKGFAYQGAACTSAGRPAAAPSRTRSGVSVEPVERGNLALALELCTTVLGRQPLSPRTIEDRRAELPDPALYQLLLARVDGEPAAIASVFFHEQAAYLSGAMTLPALRRRGCQGALLDARVQEAARRGCDRVVTDTLGDNESQRNVERAGLRPVCWLGFWVRPLPGAPPPPDARL